MQRVTSHPQHMEELQTFKHSLNHDSASCLNVTVTGEEGQEEQALRKEEGTLSLTYLFPQSP